MADYEERIEDMQVKLHRKIDLVALTKVCMEMKTSEFDELEDTIEALHDTKNDSGIEQLADDLRSMVK